MAKRPTRVNPVDQPGILSSNPFAGLRVPSGESPADAPVVSAPEERADEKPRYRVAVTRKGGLPIFVERRAAGKVVTVIRNVSGDRSALLNALKKRCGAGGVVRDEAIELQGDHRERVEAFLRDER